MQRLALLFCLAIPLLAQQGPFNLDFQESGPEGVPTGWAWAPSPSYYIAMVDGCRTPDSRCAKVIHQDQHRRGDRAYVTQSFDATAFRGQQIRYSAFLLLDEPAHAQAQLFVRVDRPSGVGFNAYTSLDHRIRTRNWTMRQIAGRIDEDAVRITIGLTFTGIGPAYFADPEFDTIVSQP